MSHGQGKGTYWKERCFYALFRESLRISKARSVWDFPYWHIDLTAGGGFNEKARCNGSPLVFLDAAEQICRGGPIHARFCDHRRAAVADLAGRLRGAVTRLPDGSSVSWAVADNGMYLPHVAGQIREAEARPECAVGTAVFDPNGPAGLPLVALEEFAPAFRRIDLILNMNVSWYAMARGCLSPRKPPSERMARQFARVASYPSMPEIVERLLPHRRHWYIRNPSSGGMRFLTIFGSELPRDCFDTFVPLDSPAGQEILRTLRHVATGQRWLFDPWRQT